MGRLDKLRTSPKIVLFVASFALFVEEFLYGMVAPLTPESPAHVQDEHMISTLYGAYALGLILSTPALGILTDRIGRYKPMLLGVLLLAASAVLFWLGTNTEVLFVARVMQGAGAACTWTASLSLVAEYWVHSRVKGMGYAMLGATTGSIVGPVVGGWMFDKGGYSAPFVFVVALLAVDALFRFFLIPHRKKIAQVPWKETFTELGGIVLDKSVLSAAFAVALAAASWALMEPLFPMHVKRIADASPSTVGVLFTVSNFLYAFMAPVVGWVSDRIGVRHTTVLGLVLTAVFMPLLAFAPNLVLAGGVLCLITVSYALTINPTSAELGDAVDRRGSSSYAVAYAIYNLAYSFGMIAVDAYVQFVTDSAHHLELLHILLIMSGLFLLCTPLFLFKPRDMRDEAAKAETTPSSST